MAHKKYIIQFFSYSGDGKVIEKFGDNFPNHTKGTAKWAMVNFLNGPWSCMALMRQWWEVKGLCRLGFATPGHRTEIVAPFFEIHAENILQAAPQRFSAQDASLKLCFIVWHSHRMKRKTWGYFHTQKQHWTTDTPKWMHDWLFSVQQCLYFYLSPILRCFARTLAKSKCVACTSWWILFSSYSTWNHAGISRVRESMAHSSVVAECCFPMSHQGLRERIRYGPRRVFAFAGNSAA